MTTKEKIEQIIEKRYKNYQGNADAQLKQYYDVMRFFVSEEKYLEFLEKYLEFLAIMEVRKSSSSI